MEKDQVKVGEQEFLEGLTFSLKTFVYHSFFSGPQNERKQLSLGVDDEEELMLEGDAIEIMWCSSMRIQNHLILKK